MLVCQRKSIPARLPSAAIFPISSRSRRAAKRAAAVGLVCAYFVFAAYAGSGGSDRTFKVGFQNSPPYHFPDANGNPTGPAVDVFKEAARRRNVRLEWRYSPEGPEKALSSGAVDFWPIVGDLPERQPFLSVTCLLYTSRCV